MSRTLDLDKIIQTYDELKVGDKKFKIGAMKTKTLLAIQKLLEDNKDKTEAEMTPIIVDQIFIILSQDNQDVTKEEIEAWGVPAQIKFLNWFSEPFLGKSQPEEPKKK